MTKWNLTDFEQKIDNEMAENSTKEENGNGTEFVGHIKNSTENLKAEKELAEKIMVYREMALKYFTPKELPPIDFSRDGRPQRASIDEDTAPVRVNYVKIVKFGSA